MDLQFSVLFVFSLLFSKYVVNSNPTPSPSNKIPKELEWDRDYDPEEFERSIKSLVLKKSESHADAIVKAKIVLAMYLKFGPITMYRTTENTSSELLEVLESMYSIIESHSPFSNSDADDLQEISNQIVVARVKARKMKQNAEEMVIGEVKPVEDLLNAVKSEYDEIPIKSHESFETKQEVILHQISEGIEYSDVIISNILDYFPELNQALDHIENAVKRIKLESTPTNVTYVDTMNEVSKGVETIKAKLDHIKVSVIDLCYFRKSEWRTIFQLINQMKEEILKQRSGIRKFLSRFF